MSWIGDISLGQTFDTKFCTVQSTGAPTTLAGTPAISCYVGNGTTEITAGITLTADFDSRTGLNNVRVVATVGNGYAQATDNQLVITTGTVNSVSAVGYVVAEFSIQNRSNSLIGSGVGAFPMSGIVDAGTAQSVTGTTIVLRSAAAFADSELVGATVVILSASTGAGQRRIITAYTGSTDTATVDTWTTTPTGTIIYAIYGTPPGSSSSPIPADMTKILGTAVSTPATAGILDVNLKNIANATVSTSSAQLGVNVVTGTGSYGVKKNTQLAGFPFYMTDSTTHAAKTGLTVTAERSIDGGAFAACANSPVEVANGEYKITLAAADLNGNSIMLKFTAAAADQRMITIITSP